MPPGGDSLFSSFKKSVTDCEYTNGHHDKAALCGTTPANKATFDCEYWNIPFELGSLNLNSPQDWTEKRQIAESLHCTAKSNSIDVTLSQVQPCRIILIHLSTKYVTRMQETPQRLGPHMLTSSPLLAKHQTSASAVFLSPVLLHHATSTMDLLHSRARLSPRWRVTAASNPLKAPVSTWKRYSTNVCVGNPRERCFLKSMA